eukprot:CAMPEP_0183568108 /NCGR_PEP_ID=MMETSP0371-20130417/116203_1 /TAXON_ID=268820 /ORGANISM="Peridinium aciculiferum, Strain PAER-2" /LENGTH=38 /DNA_ID= /DNA_START= /DNA_END= /DNA_ORIENTATION=
MPAYHVKNESKSSMSPLFPINLQVIKRFFMTLTSIANA